MNILNLVRTNCIDTIYPSYLTNQVKTNFKINGKPQKLNYINLSCHVEVSCLVGHYTFFVRFINLQQVEKRETTVPFICDRLTFHRYQEFKANWTNFNCAVYKSKRKISITLPLDLVRLLWTITNND